MAGVLQMVLAAGGLTPAVITDQTVDDSAVLSAVSATYTLGNTGTASYTTLNSGSGNYSGEWVPVTVDGSKYDVRWTVISGSPTGSATGSWLSLGTSRSWTVSRGTVGNTTASGTVEIRNAATLIVMDSATITLQATYSP